MQEIKPCDGKELICINVDKVYDWIVKERTFDFTPTGPIAFTPTASVPAGAITNATVTCDVSPTATNPIVILHREDRPLSIDGANVCLQQLTIQQNFDVVINVTLADGTVLTSASTPLTRCEQVTLCAPFGTNIEVTYTDLDCFICTTGTVTGGTGATAGMITFGALTITVSTCQSIQSTFPVTVEFLADFCEPRADIAMSCAPPSRPQHCSVFPDAGGHCCH